MKNAKIKEVPVFSVYVRKKLTLLTDTVTKVSNSRRDGITLIELVIGMVLIAIIALVVAHALSTGIKGFFVVDYRKEAIDQARIAMERMTKEMRNVRSISDVGTATASEFCFINTAGTRIDFRYETPYIRRLEAGGACPGGAGTGGDILSTSITNFTFKNPDGTDLDATTLATTKRIMITITSTAGTESVSLQTEVWPRNL